jgi:serine/threonine-protein kinase RsbW
MIYNELAIRRFSMADEQPRRAEFDDRQLIVRAEFTVCADLSAIDIAVKQVLSIAGEMGCAKGSEFEIETAIREALANAIVHGCGNDPSKTATVSVGCDETRGMVIVIRDPGEGFDPSKLPNPVVGEHVYSESGRGIYLINQLMDEVRIRRAGGTEIWMRKS